MAAILNISSLYNDANLKGYYRQESGALGTDSSSNGNDLTAGGTVNSTTGVFGGAADFGSKAGYLNKNTDLGISNGAFTIVGWFYFTSVAASFDLANYADTTNQVFSRFGWYQPSGYFVFYRVKNGVLQQGPTYTITPSTNTWYHLAITYDATNVRGYLDGALVGAATAASGNGSSAVTAGTSIGADGQSLTTASLPGYADDVAFFNRALSGTEINTIYSSTSHTKDLSETVTISEPVVSKATTRISTDTLTITDTILKSIARTFTETALTIMERFVGRFGRASQFTQQEPDDGNWTRIG